MIPASDELKKVLKTSHAIKINAGCLIEYNLNSMVNNITVTGPDYKTINSTQPFKKLFPLDSIVKPIRPELAGIKYYINGDISSQEWAQPTDVSYSKDYRVCVPGANTYYKYFITPIGQNSNISIDYPKTIFVNKIVVKFEISHSIPPSWTISATAPGGTSLPLLSGTSSDIKPFKTGGVKNYNAGSLTIYYTGTGWSKNESDLNTSARVSINKVGLSVNVSAGEYVGIIEVAPKYVIDVSNDVESFDILKESSSSSKDTLPVGYISANSLSMQLNRYNSQSIKSVSYVKNTTEFQDGIMYFYKLAEVKPHFKVYHANGAYGSSEKYDIINQGKFFMDSWSISEYGNVNLECLDGAKILQEIVSPDILCEGYSATAIIRRLLDSVGFTNYNINLHPDLNLEKSIIAPAYWWTDDSATVWETLQQICRDGQITAVFDESNVLQFYTRNFLYREDRSVDWKATYNNLEEGSSPNIITIIPNIVSMSKQDLPSANKVIVRWQSALTSNYFQDNSPIWKSPVSYLGALSLDESLLSSQAAGENSWVKLSPVVTDDNTNIQSLFSFSGYLLIQSEIIEYDAIEYEYYPLTATLPINPLNWVKVVIKDESDVFKYRALARAGAEDYTKPQTAFFKPTGRYRIKTRQAFSTPLGNHIATNNSKDILAQWTTIDKKWDGTGTSTTEKNSSIMYGGADAANTKRIESAASGFLQNNVLNDKNSVSAERSLFCITNDSILKTDYSLAYKQLTSMPTSIPTTGNNQHHTFGTTMFMDNNENNPIAGGGLGFFMSSDASSGYIIKIDTSAKSSAIKSKNELSILKIQGNTIKPLDDSQTEDVKLSGIYGGDAYRMDIRVKSTTLANTITVYVNGYMIEATDTKTVENSILSPTNIVAMISTTGTTKFDYVYGIKITPEQYNEKYTYNLYGGRFSSNSIKFLYGEKFFNQSSDVSPVNGQVEEFGIIAREIRKVDIKYSSRPAKPLWPSTGANQFASVIGSQTTPFSAEAYVLNNSGTYVPLDDGDNYSFYVGGKTISRSGVLEYVDDSSNEFTSEEPVIFSSQWLQNNSDVVNLAQWIKTQWAKKQMVSSLEMFGNPLISVGDVISINYIYHGLDGTQKFIVTNVDQSYLEGLSTSIVCRTL
jgi:hypothetical protein